MDLRLLRPLNQRYHTCGAAFRTSHDRLPFPVGRPSYGEAVPLKQKTISFSGTKSVNICFANRLKERNRVVKNWKFIPDGDWGEKRNAPTDEPSGTGGGHGTYHFIIFLGVNCGTMCNSFNFLRILRVSSIKVISFNFTGDGFVIPIGPMVLTLIMVTLECDVHLCIIIVTWPCIVVDVCQFCHYSAELGKLPFQALRFPKILFDIVRYDTRYNDTAHATYERFTLQSTESEPSIIEKCTVGVDMHNGLQ